MKTLARLSFRNASEFPRGFSLFFVFAILLMTPTHALAAGRSGTPELFYQPAAGSAAASLEARQFTPEPKVAFNSGGAPLSNTVYSSSGYELNAAYGLSESWAVNATIGTADLTSKLTDQFGSTTTKSSGFEDTRLMITSSSALGGWTLHVGLGVSLSTGKRLDASSSGPGNMLSGGTGLIDYVGLSTPFGSGNYYGARASYTTLMVRAANPNTGPGAQDYQISGGNSLAVDAFLETSFIGIEADAAAGMIFYDPEVSTFAGGGTATNDAYKSVRFAIGAQYEVVSAWTLRIGYEMLMIGDRNYPAYAASPYTQSTFSARVRYEF